jgi:hypothetical protein
LLSQVKFIKFLVQGTQIYTRYTQPRGVAHSMGHKAAAIWGQEEQTFHNIKIIMTHIKNTIKKAHSAVDSLKSGLPEDGPVRPKHVAPITECIYILMTFKNFDKHFNELNVD